MSSFSRDPSGRATLGGVRLDLVADHPEVTSPAYVYDLDGIGSRARDVVRALPGPKDLVAYAVKANTAGSILRRIAEAGAGADVVSGGELSVALGCGIGPNQIVMSGVGKTTAELDQALGANIRAIQVESVEEIERLGARAAALGLPARIALRINPSVEIDSHAHISTGHKEAKFGIPMRDLPEAWQCVNAHSLVRAVGVSTHVGSMLRSPDPYLASARAVCDVARARIASGFPLDYVNFGGGFGIDYAGADSQSPPQDFVAAAVRFKTEQGLGDVGLVVEPGRSLVGPFGVLLTRVIQRKNSGSRRWALVDAAMNDLLRPALYSAPHRIEPVDFPPAPGQWWVAGPVCESTDQFGAHELGEELPGLLVVRDAGAYGFPMASEYNGRPLPAEVFLVGGSIAKVSASPGVAAWVKRRLAA